MNQNICRWRCAMVVALSLLGAGVAQAAPAPASPGSDKAALLRIEAQAKADARACRRVKDNARDLCELQAKGREKVARAELAAQLKPTPEAQQEAKEVRAAVDHAVAKKQCDALAKGKAKDTCVSKARTARDAAIRQAKVEKVDKVQDMKSEAGEHRRKPQGADTADQRYQSLKARCGLMGTERDKCMAELNRRFQKT